MAKFTRFWMMAAGLLAATCLGCSPKLSQEPAARKPAATSESVGTVKEPTASKPKPQEPPPPPVIPKVTMSDELRATCLVNVGDNLAKVELPDLAGKMHSLDSLYGPKLTVVCFWTVGTTRRAQLVATDALHYLMKDVAEPFEKKGVRVVGINVDGEAAEVQQNVGNAGATFPCLLDTQGGFFAKIAKDRKMPRIYLLDAEGKILWFDVEFSRSTREDLVQGIRVALGELK